MNDQAKLTLAYPFLNVHAELPKIKQVDGMSGGLSPITFRWLTSKNRYVNIGLEETSPAACRIEANNNSFSVTPEELVEIFTAVKTHMDGLKKPLPDLSQPEYKSVSVKGKDMPHKDISKTLEAQHAKAVAPQGA